MLTFSGVFCLLVSWRTYLAGTQIIYWNRGSPITPQILFFAGGWFLVFGVVLLILQHRQR